MYIFLRLFVFCKPVTTSCLRTKLQYRQLKPENAHKSEKGLQKNVYSIFVVLCSCSGPLSFLYLLLIYKIARL